MATSLDEALIAEFLDSCMGAFRPTVVGQGARRHARDRLEHRRLPGCWRQLVALVHRYELKLFRALLEKLAGFAFSFLGAFVFASNSGPSKDFDSLMFMSLFQLLICFGCLEIRAALKCYQRDRVVVWRETSSGVSMLAYFVARDVCELPVLAYRAVIFTAVTASVMRPVIPTVQVLFIFLATGWHCSSMGHVISLLFPPAAAQMASLVAGVILGPWEEPIG